jgi:ribose transport system permease protein
MMAFHGWSLFESCIATIAIGSLAGMLNGILISIGNLNGIIATLGTGAIMSALVLWYTNNASVSSPLSSTLLNIGSRHFLGVPRIAFIALVIAIVVGILMTQTPYGRMLTSIGSNRRAARLVGVRVKRTVLLSFVLSGAIASIAGILLIAQQGSSNPSQDGLSLILPAITALFLGAAAFYPGQYNVPGAVTGLVLVNALVSGLTIVGVASWVQPLCNGLALIIGVGASALLRAKRLGGDEA